MDLALHGRTALVTGGYRGTGAGIAAALVAEGAHVLVHGFEPGQPDEVVDELRSTGGTASAVVGDLGSDLAIDEVDILVNNFGSPGGSSWADADAWADEWDRNVLTGVRVAQRLMGGMRDRAWGRIVFIGTVGARRPGTHSPGYYAAKAALHTVVRTLAIELRGTGVTVNLVSPGMIATAEVREMLTRRAGRRGVGPEWNDVERWALDHAMPNLTERIPNPTDIGRVVAFVAGEPAWHITGADIAVDGGSLDAGSP